MGKYDDIMSENWNGPRKHIHMDMASRAKIFLPFAALKGYEDTIEERSHLQVIEDEMYVEEDFGL